MTGFWVDFGIGVAAWFVFVLLVLFFLSGSG